MAPSRWRSGTHSSHGRLSLVRIIHSSVSLLQQACITTASHLQSRQQRHHVIDCHITHHMLPTSPTTWALSQSINLTRFPWWYHDGTAATSPYHTVIRTSRSIGHQNPCLWASTNSSLASVVTHSLVISQFLVTGDRRLCPLTARATNGASSCARPRISQSSCRRRTPESCLHRLYLLRVSYPPCSPNCSPFGKVYGIVAVVRRTAVPRFLVAP